MKLDILQEGSPLLKFKCLEVDHGENLDQLFTDMLDTLKGSGGIGLAANQIGNTSRVIWVCCSAYTGFIVNPEIIEASGKLKKSSEGCLSLKGQKLKRIERDRKILVTGYNHKWEPLGIDARNASAFVVQHEIDHLDGITLNDK
jgi:peptide deformylase